MDKFAADQAEGLRRLLSRVGPRVLAVTGGPGAPGRTTTVVNLASALATQGKDVLVIDERPGGAQSVCAMTADGNGASTSVGSFQGDRAGSFAAVMRGELALEEALVRHAAGFGVLAAPRESRAQYTDAQLQKVLASSADVVLVDAQLDADGALSPFAAHAHDVLVVMRVVAHEITDAYACMKRLHFAHAIRQFRVLMNHVSSVGEAQVVFENLAGVASRYLSIALESAGYVAADPYMARARQLARCIVDAFPSTAAARDYRRLAADLPHWPMRPAVSPRPAGASRFMGAGSAVHAGPFVSTVTGVMTSAPPSARAGRRADPPEQWPSPQHA